jgi:hypothetical protein
MGPALDFLPPMSLSCVHINAQTLYSTLSVSYMALSVEERVHAPERLRDVVLCDIWRCSNQSWCTLLAIR